LKRATFANYHKYLQKYNITWLKSSVMACTSTRTPFRQFV
jgi:hypothetical protein